MTNDGKRDAEAGMLNWPMHLDSSVTRALQEHEKAMAAEAFVGDNEELATTTTSTTTMRPTRDTLAAFDECPQLSGLNFVEICPNIENITARCVQFLRCSCAATASGAGHKTKFKQKKQNVSTTKRTENRNGNVGDDIDMTAGVISAQMPKYDFIVLDVVHENAAANNNNHNNNNKSSVSTNAAMLDFNSGVKTDINSTVDAVSTVSIDSIKWRPLLILEQHEINSNTYITHSGYDEWLLVSTVQLWQCGTAG